MEELITRYACESGASHACFRRAEVAIRAGATGYAKALPWLELGCQGHHTKACAMLGAVLIVGDAQIRDYHRARALLQGGCSAGEPLACHNLAELLEYALGGERDEARAERLYRENCARGFEYSCAFAGRRDLFAGDEVRARAGIQPLERGCESGTAEACAALGLARIAGIGVARDLEVGRQLLDKACERNWAKACEFRKTYEKTPPAAASLYASCALRRAAACAQLRVDGSSTR